MHSFIIHTFHTEHHQLWSWYKYVSTLIMPRYIRIIDCRSWWKNLHKPCCHLVLTLYLVNWRAWLFIGNCVCGVCLFVSAVSLASKCSTSAFRMHIRADDTLLKMLSALHDASQDPVRCYHYFSSLRHRHSLLCRCLVLALVWVAIRLSITCRH